MTPLPQTVWVKGARRGSVSSGGGDEQGARGEAGHCVGVGDPEERRVGAVATLSGCRGILIIVESLRRCGSARIRGRGGRRRPGGGLPATDGRAPWCERHNRAGRHLTAPTSAASSGRVTARTRTAKVEPHPQVRRVAHADRGQLAELATARTRRPGCGREAACGAEQRDPRVGQHRSRGGVRRGDRSSWAARPAIGFMRGNGAELL